MVEICYLLFWPIHTFYFKPIKNSFCMIGSSNLLSGVMFVLQFTIWMTIRAQYNINTIPYPIYPHRQYVLHTKYSYLFIQYTCQINKFWQVFDDPETIVYLDTNLSTSQNLVTNLSKIIWQVYITHQITPLRSSTNVYVVHFYHTSN